MIKGWFNSSLRLLCACCGFNYVAVRRLKVDSHGLAFMIYASIKLVVMVPECCGVLNQPAERRLKLMTDTICRANHWHYRSVIKCNKANDQESDQCRSIACEDENVQHASPSYQEREVYLTAIPLLHTPHKLIFNYFVGDWWWILILCSCFNIFWRFICFWDHTGASREATSPNDRNRLCNRD